MACCGRGTGFWPQRHRGHRGFLAGEPRLAPTGFEVDVAGVFCGGGTVFLATEAQRAQRFLAGEPRLAPTGFEVVVDGVFCGDGTSFFWPQRHRGRRDFWRASRRLARTGFNKKGAEGCGSGGLAGRPWGFRGACRAVVPRAGGSRGSLLNPRRPRPPDDGTGSCRVDNRSRAGPGVHRDCRVR